MALADLNVRLGLISDNFQKGIRNAEKSLRNFGRQAEFIGRDLTNALTLPIVAAGTAAVKSFADFEKSAKSLEAVVGSAEEAAVQIERLQKVAQLPGLGFQEAVQASARLQAVGLSAGQAEAAISEFGNAVARSGGGRAEFDGAILALTQIASKGKISAEEINQLNERIFEIRPALVAAFGTADSEQLQKLGISSEEFIAKVTAEFSKLERVQGGLANAFENFGDTVRTSLATIGQEISEALNIEGVLNSLSNGLSKVAELFSGLDESTRRNIVVFAAVAAAIGPVILAIGKLSLAAKGIIGVFSAGLGVFKALGASLIALAANPIGLVVAGIAAIAAGAVIAYQRSEEFRRIVNALGAAFIEAFKIAKERFEGIAQVIRAAFGVAAEVFQRVFTIFKTGISTAFTAAAPVFRRIGEIIVQFGKIAGGVFINTFNVINGFVSGTIKLVSELVRIVSEGVTAFLSGFDRLTEGDISGALTAFGEGLKKSNPIGIAFTQGGRLADSFGEGFESGFGAVDRIVGAFSDKYQEQLNQIDVTAPAPVIASGATAPAGNPFADTFERLGSGSKQIRTLEKLNELAVLNGSAFGLLAEKVDLSNIAAVQSKGSYDAASEALAKVKANGDKWSESLSNGLIPLQQQYGESNDEFLGKIEQFNQALTGVVETGLSSFVEGFGEAIGALASGSASAGQVLAGLTGIFADLLGRLGKIAIETGIGLLAIQTAFKSLNPIVALTAGVALIAFSKLIKAKVKNVGAFAEGGLVFGPTIGLVGEGPGTSRTNPEVIAPLDKLKDFIGAAPANDRGFVASTRISGSDLLILIEDEQNRQGRIR